MPGSIFRWYIHRQVERLGHTSDDVAVRAESRLILFGKMAIPQVLQVVDHPDPRVRFRAIWVLGRSRDPAVFEAVLSHVEDSDHRVAYDAMMALGQLGDSRAIPYLKLLAIKFDGHPEGLGGAALSALSRLGVELESDE